MQAFAKCIGTTLTVSLTRGLEHAKMSCSRSEDLAHNMDTKEDAFHDENVSGDATGTTVGDSAGNKALFNAEAIQAEDVEHEMSVV